jgi:hypothetical protein
MLPSDYLDVALFLLLHVHIELLTGLTPRHTVLLVFREVGKVSEVLFRFFIPAHFTRRHSILFPFFSGGNQTGLNPIEQPHLG